MARVLLLRGLLSWLSLHRGIEVGLGRGAGLVIDLREGYILVVTEAVAEGTLDPLGNSLAVGAYLKALCKLLRSRRLLLRVFE